MLCVIWKRLWVRSGFLWLQSQPLHCFSLFQARARTCVWVGSSQVEVARMIIPNHSLLKIKNNECTVYVLKFLTYFQNNFLYMINIFNVKNGNTQVICKNFKTKTFGVLIKYIDVKTMDFIALSLTQLVMFCMWMLQKYHKQPHTVNSVRFLNIQTHIKDIHEDLQMSFPVIWSDVCMICIVLPYWPLIIPIRWTELILLIDFQVSIQQI